MRKQVPGFISNIRFRNITLDGQPGDYLVQLEGADAEHDVSDVTFENVSVAGSKLTKKSKSVHIGKHTRNIQFRAETP